jgi:hypothetical protein
MTASDYNPAHYRARYWSRLGPVEIEDPLPPITPAWHDWAAAFLVVFAIFCVLLWSA